MTSDLQNYKTCVIIVYLTCLLKRVSWISWKVLICWLVSLQFRAKLTHLGQYNCTNFYVLSHTTLVQILTLPITMGSILGILPFNYVICKIGIIWNNNNTDLTGLLHSYHTFFFFFHNIPNWSLVFQEILI